MCHLFPPLPYLEGGIGSDVPLISASPILSGRWCRVCCTTYFRSPSYPAGGVGFDVPLISTPPYPPSYLAGGIRFDIPPISTPILSGRWYRVRYTTYFRSPSYPAGGVGFDIPLISAPILSGRWCRVRCTTLRWKWRRLRAGSRSASTSAPPVTPTKRPTKSASASKSGRNPGSPILDTLDLRSRLKVISFSLLLYSVIYSVFISAQKYHMICRI